MNEEQGKKKEGSRGQRVTRVKETWQNGTTELENLKDCD